MQQFTLVLETQSDWLLLKPETKRRLSCFRKGFYEQYIQGQWVERPLATHGDLMKALAWVMEYTLTELYPDSLVSNMVMPILKYYASNIESLES